MNRVFIVEYYDPKLDAYTSIRCLSYEEAEKIAIRVNGRIKKEEKKDD